MRRGRLARPSRGPWPALLLAALCWPAPVAAAAEAVRGSGPALDGAASSQGNARVLDRGAAVRGEGPALDRVAAELAGAAAALAPAETTRLALAIDAASPALASAAELALAAALRDAGFAPPRAARDAADAERRGADALLTVRVALRGETLVAAGELRGVRENFFTGDALVGGGALAASARADDAARLLAAGAGPIEIEVLPFAALAAPPLALAVGPLGGSPCVAAITRDEIVLWDAKGAVRARYALPAPGGGAQPARDPRAGLVIAGDRVRWALPERARAEVLRLQGGALVAERELPADVVPLAAGSAGVLAAQLAGHENLFQPTLLLGFAPPSAPLGSSSADGVAAPRAVAIGQRFVAALAAPGGGALPFGVIDASGVYRALDAELAPAARTIAGIGDAAALADLDGDGEAELVVTAPVPAAPDRVRVHSLHAATVPVESGPIAALLLTAAAGDLGDGADEVIFGSADGKLFRVRRAAP